MPRSPSLGGDGINKVDAADPLGWTRFVRHDSSENLSTHNGRMVVLDDWALLFADPSTPPNAPGFDLRPVAGA